MPLFLCCSFIHIHAPTDTYTHTHTYVHIYKHIHIYHRPLPHTQPWGEAALPGLSRKSWPWPLPPLWAVSRGGNSGPPRVC